MAVADRLFRWFLALPVVVFGAAVALAATYVHAGGPPAPSSSRQTTEPTAQSRLASEELIRRIRLKSPRRQAVSGMVHTRRNGLGIAANSGSGSLATGFEPGEGFVPGPIDGQAGWFAFFPADIEGHIDTVQPGLGTQHLRISWEPALVPPVNTGAFSPNLGALPTGSSTTRIDVAISANGGADYFVGGQSNSEGFLTWEVNFSFLGTIWVVDDLGSGLTFVDTGFAWTIGPYKTLTVLDDPVSGGTVYLYDDIQFYSQVTHLQGTRVEQVVLRSDNFHLNDDGDFDNLSVTAGIDCDDGIACTTDTFDTANGCVNTPVDAQCDNSNVCTVDICDIVLGCVHDGTGIVVGCDDGDACTTGDVCVGDTAGTCAGTDTSAVDCNDGIACTTDTCVSAEGCSNMPVDAVCADTNVCTLDTCDAALGCLHNGTGIVVGCDDGDVCTTGDVCVGDVAGTCAGTDTSAVDCNDGVACTTDTCDSAIGCSNTPVDAACDDTNVCTLDTCDAALGCLHNGTGIVVGCDDGDVCTTGDVCVGDVAGTCAGTDTSAVDCNDGVACTTDTCDSAIGCSNTPVDAACDDTNVCTLNTCNIVLGCVHDGTGITVGCDDGDACTTGDVCVGDTAGTCAGTDTSAVDCNDGVACTADTCDSAIGCVNAPIDAECDDTNVCTLDTCDAALGCVHDGTGIIIGCDDGDVCTTGDVCQADTAGTCAGFFIDTDGDGVCDAADLCPGGDDANDCNGNGIPDACDVAFDCNGNPIPAVSEWGLVVTTLLTLTAATVILLRRRSQPLPQCPNIRTRL